MSLREQYLGAARAAFPTGEVQVPEWSADPVRIRGLSSGEYSEILVDFKLGDLDRPDVEARKRLRSLYPRIVVYGVVDAEGRQVFSEGDVARLENEQPQHVIQRIGVAILNLSGAGDEAAAERGKDSAPPPSEPSST